MILDFWNISINDNVFDFFNLYTNNLNYDLFQSRFNLYTNYKHLYYYFPVNDNVSILQIYFESKYYNPFNNNLGINFQSDISYRLINDISYPLFNVFTSTLSSLWRTITFSKDYIMPDFKYKSLLLNMSKANFELLMGDNFSRYLSLNTFYQMNEFFYFNLVNYGVPLRNININSASFLHLFVWKDLFFEKSVDEYAFSYGELHFLDKVYPLVLGYFPSYSICINYSDIYNLPIWLNFFNDWGYWIKFKNTMIYLDSFMNYENINSVIYNNISYILIYSFINYHYPASLDWSEFHLIQYIYSNTYSNNYLVIWCSLFILFIVVLRFILLFFLSILLLYLWLINIKLVIILRKKYMEIFKNYFSIFLNYIFIKLKQFNNYLIKNYVYDVLLFKPFWVNRTKLFWFSLEYKYFLSLTKGDNRMYDEYKTNQWYHKYLLKSYTSMMSQYIVGYFFRYFYFFIHLLIFSIINSIKYLGVRFIVLSGILVFFYYIRIILVKIIWYFININLIKNLWKIYIVIINKFLVWFFFRFNFSRIRTLTYWYHKIPYYYRVDTFHIFPLNHSFFIIKLFSLFYLIDFNNLMKKIKISNFTNSFFFDVLIILLFKVINIFYVIIYYLLQFKYKFIYKFILIIISSKFNILNSLIINKKNLLSIIFFIFFLLFIIYFNLYFILFTCIITVLIYFNLLNYINKLYKYIFNYIFIILGSLVYFSLFYFSFLFRWLFILIFYIIFKLKFIIFFIILFNMGFDFIFFMI